MPHTVYHVAPRYTAGSPALVDFDTAKRVAKEEQSLYTNNLAGRYGEEDAEIAKRLGLDGIVEEQVIYSHQIKFRDFITERTGTIKDGVRTYNDAPMTGVAVKPDFRTQIYFRMESIFQYDDSLGRYAPVYDILAEKMGLNLRDRSIKNNLSEHIQLRPVLSANVLRALDSMNDEALLYLFELVIRRYSKQM
jgi:hypothetical protein